MFKILCAIITLLFITIFCSPLNFLKREVTVCNDDKSAGNFITANNLTVSSFVNASGVCFNLEEKELDCLLKSVGAKKVHSFFDGEILNVYYYSNKISKKEVIKRKRVNIHVAISNNNLKVGIPLIYYGY